MLSVAGARSRPLAVSEMATIRLAATGDSLTSGGGFCGVQTPWPQLLTQTHHFAAQNFGSTSAQSVITFQDAPEFVSMAKESRASIVAVMLGTFDATETYDEDTFVTTLRRIVTKAQNMPTLPHVALIVPPPLFRPGVSGLSAETLDKMIIPAILSVAHQEGCTLVNLRTAFRDAIPGGFPLPDAFSCDGVHLNDKGHEIVSEAVASALETARWCLYTPASRRQCHRPLRP